ncbi:MAG: hypothetical protein RLZZ500_85 [Bacteroidota bacterium]|jgi:tetratricopeptide (TPR) repeat protein
MATYNKRGYKAPKEKVENEENVAMDNQYIEDTPNVDEKDSTTARAFDALDQTASRTEEWVARNQKFILGFLGGAALITIGYLMYQKFVVEPNEMTATDDLLVTQQNFQAAVDAQDPKVQDSLFNLVVKGAEGKQSAVELASQYSGTDSGNLASYYAGIAYLNLKKYDDAIKYLEQYKGNDTFTGPIATGAIGDAYAQKNDNAKALEYYEKAARANANDFTTPRYLFKAGVISMEMGKKEEAGKYFAEIKEKYEDTPEGQQVDALIGMTK